MKAALLFIERYLIVPLEKISQQRHLVAIRDGLQVVFPLSLIGSLFYVVATLPLPESWALSIFLSTHSSTILIPYRMTVVLVTLYMVVAVGANLAKSYRFSQAAGALVALAAFLMTTVPVNPAAMIPEGFVQSAAGYGLDTSWVSGLQELGWVMPQTPMSGIGVYVGAVSAVIGVESMHFSRWFFRKIRKSRPRKKSVLPKAVKQMLETIFPLCLVVLGLFVVRDIIGFDFQKLTLSLFDSLIRSSSSLSGALLYVFALSIFSFFGVIGYSVSGSAAGVAWSRLITANQAAHLAGVLPPNIAPLPFFHYFVSIGGTGATLSIVILLCFSRSRYLKRLGQTCLLPSVVNFNQPAIYGLPVILNPYMLIPFVLGPQASALVTYLCLQLNLVARPYADPSGSFPFAIGAYLSTGDWKAVVLSIFNLLLCMAIYYPFLKAYEGKLIGEEKARKAGQFGLDKDGKLKRTEVE